MSMPTPTVDGKRAEAIRQRLRDMRDGEFEGNLSALARSLRVTPAYVSDVLNEKRGPGMKLLKALARALNLSLDDLVGESQQTTSLGPRWCNLPGWTEALAEARRLFPRVSDAAWEWVGGLAGVRPPAMSAVVLGSMASVWDQHAQTEQPKARTKVAASPSALIARKAATG